MQEQEPTRPEQRPIDPFQASINRFNKILYTETYDSDNVRRALMETQITGFQAKLEPDKLFDRLYVLASQAGMVAEDSRDPSSDEFFRMAESYKAALANFIAPAVQAAIDQVTNLSSLSPMTGRKGR